ncbi:DUF4263 domain-containing protein [Phycisphaeraceae bacterium D3-23]
MPRVLVEYVANAHDADADSCEITCDTKRIETERKSMRSAYKNEKEQHQLGKRDTPPLALAHQELPEDIQIIIKDDGDGMSQDDLDNKFLVAGRRRRKEPTDGDPARTPKGRLIMGRKGLGKFAGFGVAKHISVISKKEDESWATQITLDFDQIRQSGDISEIKIPAVRLDDGGGIRKKGTVIVLSRLLFEPVKSRAGTIVGQIAEHFEFIRKQEFLVRFNGGEIQPIKRSLAFAYPEDASLKNTDLVKHDLDTEDGAITFNYRIRFTGDKDALPAQRRGVRVYAHRRLAAAPSLLDADTNMHGFRMTDYLDGVLEADFIDDQEADYIATDRQSLRWETPLLEPLREFLSKEIKAACAAYQKHRDDVTPNAVKSDVYTQGLLSKYSLSGKDKTLGLRIASSLASSCKQGIDDPIYKGKLEPIIQGVGHGNILTTITDLANEQHPALNRVAVEIARLTKDELERSVGYARARLKGIEALEKIVGDQSFKEKQNEKEIQKLLENSPWLIDPTYAHMLSGDTQYKETIDRLARSLGISNYAPLGSENDAKRPDLVFLNGNMGLGKIVIIELKSANTPLIDEHLQQLKGYRQLAKQWLRDHQLGHVKVEGHLIGSVAEPTSKAKGVLVLNAEIEEAGPNTPWSVRDYTEVLTGTKAAHIELITAHEASEADATSQEENSDDAASTASADGTSNSTA